MSGRTHWSLTLAKLLGDRIVPRRKIVEYLLNEAHSEGGSKARFFKMFGFDSDAPEVMTDALGAHPDVNPLTAQATTSFGLTSVVECNLATPDGRNPCIRSVWNRKTGSAVHQLVTAYPSRRR